ncbi:MAG: glucose-6-phosphate isomerase, partial [Clostridia bacterium]|nr:glucose-6-phosphate isomerase [Clostridia bacterium]
WWQQLFGETQGKDKKGIFPICNVNTSNLHSIGQYLQDGEDIIFETVLRIKDLGDFKLANADISFSDLNNIVLDQVAVAHAIGNTPSIIISIDQISAYNLGGLIYFFFIAAAAGGYLLEVNPYDQPGVEEYKKLIKQKTKDILKN